MQHQTAVCTLRASVGIPAGRVYRDGGDETPPVMGLELRIVHNIIYIYIKFGWGGGRAGARLAQVGGARVLPGITFTARTLLDVKVPQLLMYGSTEASIEEAI